MIQLNWFPQLVGGPRRQVRHVCRHNGQEDPHRWTLTVEPNLSACTAGKPRVVLCLSFLVDPDNQTEGYGSARVKHYRHGWEERADHFLGCAPGRAGGSCSALSSAFSPLAVGGGCLLCAACALLTAAGHFGWCLGRGGLQVVVACFLCVCAPGAVTSVLC